ncbi:MAG: glycosyltransferase [Anaerolineales bacterium]
MTRLERLLVVSNTDWFVANFMLPFLSAHLARGVVVVAMTPEGPYREALQKAGIRWRPLRLSRSAGDPFATLASLVALRRAYREERPNVIHHATAVPVLLGTLASTWAGRPPVINVVPGLGHFFTGVTAQNRAARFLLRLGLRWAARQPGAVIVFQQDADREQILLNHDSQLTSHLIPGWGIDLSRFSPRAQPAEAPMVLLPARMLWTKGVEEFVEAARRCRSVVQARFVLAGAPDPGNPGSIPVSRIREWESEGAVEWWGHRSDMPDVLSQASIVVLPTRYGEGVPQSLIEASAMEIPIVATDIPGCRQVVEPGVNGILVPPGNPDRLAEALLRLLKDPAERRRLGSRGRSVVARKFGVETILASYREIYRELGLELPGM